MDDDHFRGLTAQLGALTKGQRRRVRAALAALEKATLVVPAARSDVSAADDLASHATAILGNSASLALNGDIKEAAACIPTIDDALLPDSNGDLNNSGGVGADATACGLASRDAATAHASHKVMSIPCAIASCQHCGGSGLRPWGSTEAGRARWRCVACKHTRLAPEDASSAVHDFIDMAHPSGLPPPRSRDRLRLRDKFQQVRDDMLTNQPPSDCRSLAASLDVDKMTVWRWRQRILRSIQASTAQPALEPGVAAGQATWAPTSPVATKPIRESRKASREWVAHRDDPASFPAPDRPRWVDVDRHGEPLPRPLWTFQNMVLVGLDLVGRCCTEIVPAGPQASAARANSADAPFPHGEQRELRATCRHRKGDFDGLEPTEAGISHDDTGHLLDASHSTGAPSGDARRSQVAARVAAGADVADLNELSSDRLGSAFEEFLRQFRGPAATYLGGYAAWFAARVEHTRENR